MADVASTCWKVRQSCGSSVPTDASHGSPQTSQPRIAAMAVDPEQSFPELEERVLARWRERGVFEKSLEQRRGAEQYVFFEGPPTANGRPGAHHVLARVFKDIFPRYKTMRGFYV